MKSSDVRLIGSWSCAAVMLALTGCGPGSDAKGTGRTTASPALATSAGLHGDEGERGEADAQEEEGALRARVERGLAISPVGLDASHLSGRQRTLVGLGSYIVNAASNCAGCHSGAAGFLAGGSPFALDQQGHRVWSRNLTPDPATGLQLTRDEFRTAMRTGRDFHPAAAGMLVVMPWMYLRWASDLDLDAIYAYLRAIPPVSNAVPPDTKSGLSLPPSIPFPGAYTDGDVARALRGDHRSFDPRRGLSISPLAQPADLHGEALQAFGVGAYIANALTPCSECHTNPERTPGGARIDTAAFLTGGTVFGVPPPRRPVLKQVRSMSANLKGATHGFFYEPADSFQRFHDLIFAGAHVDESPLRPLGFPMILIASYLKNLLDEDLAAVYAYAKDLPATSGAADQARQPYARWCAAAADCRSGETCALATNECVGGACATDLDCGACQTCGGGVCQAPAAGSACVASAR